MVKKIIIASFALEIIGIGLLTTALIEGVGNNPAIYLSGIGGLFIVAGGFLFNKVLHLRK